MSGTERTIAWIDQFYRSASQRPGMYFSSPESYEDVVYVLEQLRDSLSARNTLDLGTYQQFLVDEGFQSANFTTRYRLDQSERVVDSEELFEAFNQFLSRYLRAQGR